MIMINLAGRGDAADKIVLKELSEANVSSFIGKINGEVSIFTVDCYHVDSQGRLNKMVEAIETLKDL